MINSNVKIHFENQAKACTNMGSEFTAKLCNTLLEILSPNTQTGARVINWEGDPAADALALRLCGALHGIVLSDPEDPLVEIYNDPHASSFNTVLNNAIIRHDHTLNSWLDLPPQTNETGRAGALLPGLLHIARDCNLSLNLCEIGASAGLNMQLDQFYYTYGDRNWGNQNSPVNLAPEMIGKTPDLNGELTIASRIGCDISPVDIRDPQAQLRLRAFVWPDQEFRAIRLFGAIELATQNPPEIHKLNAAKFIESQLANRPDSQAFVLMHSVVWQYLPKVEQQQIETILKFYGDKAISQNPIYWLQLEGFGGKEPTASLTLDCWPNHRHQKLANSCFHASWIEFS